MNKKGFYNTIRGAVNLTTQNVIGFERVLDYGEARGTSLHKLAYILATAFWESSQTMHPVVEAFWMSESWRRKNLRYYPWHGRGLIQTTWEKNYRRMSDELGVNLLADPDMLLEWKYALPALFVGMEKGLYTGKRLDDYIDGIDESDNEDLREYANARRIVNGTDKQITIGNLALVFERGLKAAGYQAMKKPSPPVIDDSWAQGAPPPPDIEPIPAKPKPAPRRRVFSFSNAVALVVFVAFAAFIVLMATGVIDL